MKKYLIILLTILLTACGQKYTQNDFINTDCNIPIIECVLGTDTVNMIVDTGAEYSLIEIYPIKYLLNICLTLFL